MFCNQCGQQLAGGERFCTYCAAPAPPPADKNLSGIEGWLAWVGLRLFVEPLVLLFDIYQLFSSRSIMMASPGPVAAVAYAARFAALVYLIILFLAKKALFPRYYIIYLSTALMADLFLFYLFFQHYRHQVDYDFSTSLLAALILIPYLRQSRRVKATFVK